MKRLLTLVLFLFIAVGLTGSAYGGRSRGWLDWDKAKNFDTETVIVTAKTSAGINAAIDQLPSTGGEVYLPAGDYDITATITIDVDNTTLRGAGAATRLLATNRFVYSTVTGTPADGETLTGDTTGYTATVMRVDTANKIVWYRQISNIANFNSAEVISWSGGADTTLVGAPTEQNFDVIRPNAKAHVVIRDLSVYGGNGGGNANVLIGNSSALTDDDYLLIENCHLAYSDTHAVGTAGEYVKIINNVFEDHDAYGIYDAAAATWGLIRGNSFIDNPFSIALSGDSWVVTGNAFERDTISINLLSNAQYTAVTGNTIYDTDTGGVGIKVLSDYNLIANNTVFGVTVSDRGIWLDEADYNIVTGNVVRDHDVSGIETESDCEGNLIHGNHVTDSLGGVLYLLEGVDPAGLQNGRGEIVKTGTDTLVAGEVTNTNISNIGQSATSTLTLPTAGAGMSFTFTVTDASDAIHIKAGASDLIVLNGTALDDGDKVSNATPTIYDYIVFWTVETAAGVWDWMAVTGIGTWIDGGA